jgi:lysophospholipase L1-like esterase
MNIGMNDCKSGDEGKDVFQRSLQMLFDGAAKAGSILVLNTPNLIDFVKASERKALPAYVELIREFAAKNRVPLVDHYAYWTKEVGTSARLSMWLNDGSIHPNNYGHLVLARKMFQDMGIFDAQSITGSRFFVP